MSIAILCAAVAILLSFTTGKVAVGHGPDVAARFLERGKPYDAETLSRWIQSNKGFARAYAVPVLFPLDFAMMVFLAAFLWLGSRACAVTVPWLSPAAPLAIVLPALYVVSDAIEDALLMRFLLRPETVTARAVALTRAVTRAKLLTSTAAIAQTILIAAIATFRGG